MRALAVLVLAVALAGCGEKTLMTEADVGRFEAWSKSYQEVAVEMLGLSTALAGEDVPGARERVDALAPRLAVSD
jgi:predicted trehalose synthase